MESVQCQKETYYRVKRDLLQGQKIPTTVSKETYYSVKLTGLSRGGMESATAFACGLSGNAPARAPTTEAQSTARSPAAGTGSPGYTTRGAADARAPAFPARAPALPLAAYPEAGGEVGESGGGRAGDGKLPVLAVGAPTAAVLAVGAGEEPEACESMALTGAVAVPAVGLAVACIGVTAAGVVAFGAT
jgi:hypothetical protein